MTEENNTNDIREKLKLILDFLISFEKDFELKMWESGKGYDFILDNVIISIHENSYLDFEIKEKEE